jgi:hypothetical protein
MEMLVALEGVRLLEEGIDVERCGSNLVTCGLHDRKNEKRVTCKNM